MKLDIRLDVGFPFHHKTRKFTRLAGNWTYIICLWLHARQHKPEGILTGMGPDEIKDACDPLGLCPLDANALLGALLECGFVEKRGSNYAIKNWEEHQSWSYFAPRRAEKARKAAKIKWEKYYAKSTTNDASAELQAESSYARSYAPSPSPSPSPKEKKKTKASPLALPDWLKAESWEGFAEMRKRIRKPLTERAAKLTLARLEELKDAGNDPNACLDQSIQRGWLGVFQIKKDQLVGDSSASGGVSTSRIDEMKRLIREASNG